MNSQDLNTWWTGSRLTTTLAGEAEGNCTYWDVYRKREPQWSSLEEPRLTPSSPWLQRLRPALRALMCRAQVQSMDHSETLGVGVGSITIQSEEGLTGRAELLGKNS